jgi:hypothetical protein
MKTVMGTYHHDKSGLWHYQHKEIPSTIEQVAADAIEFRQGPSWFWFDGTPAPLDATDTPTSLIQKWLEWRRVWQSSSEVLVFIANYAGVNE